MMTYVPLKLFSVKGSLTVLRLGRVHIFHKAVKLRAFEDECVRGKPYRFACLRQKGFVLYVVLRHGSRKFLLEIWKEGALLSIVVLLYVRVCQIGYRTANN